MPRNFNELRAKLSPASRARSAARSRQMLNEMLQAELRRLSGRTVRQFKDRA